MKILEKDQKKIRGRVRKRNAFSLLYDSPFNEQEKNYKQQGHPIAVPQIICFFAGWKKYYVLRRKLLLGKR